MSLLIESIVNWFVGKTFIKLDSDLFALFVMNVLFCSLCFEFVTKVILVISLPIFYSKAF